MPAEERERVRAEERALDGPAAAADATAPAPAPAQEGGPAAAGRPGHMEDALPAAPQQAGAMAGGAGRGAGGGTGAGGRKGDGGGQGGRGRAGGACRAEATGGSPGKLVAKAAA